MRRRSISLAVSISLALCMATLTRAQCTTSVATCGDLLTALGSAVSGDVICITSAITCDAAPIMAVLTTKSGITLKGTSTPRPTFDWFGAANPAVPGGNTILSNNFENLVIQGASDENVYVRHYQTCSFTNCKFVGPAQGVATRYGTHLTFVDCEFNGNSVGFYAETNNGPTNAYLTGCLFTGNTTGINVYPGIVAEKLYVTDCDFVGSTYVAINVRRAGDGRITGSTFRNNKTPGWNYTTVFSAEGPSWIFTDNLIEDTDGHSVRLRCDNSLFLDNVFIARPGSCTSQAFGTLLDGMNNGSEASGNVFYCLDGNRAIQGSKYGTYYAHYEGTQDAVIDHNTFIGSSDLTDCSNNTTQLAVQGGNAPPITGTFTNNIVVGFRACGSLPVDTRLVASNNDFYGNGDDAQPGTAQVTVDPKLASLDPDNACGAYLSCDTPTAVLNGDSDGFQMGARYLCASELSTCCSTCATVEGLALNAVCGSLSASLPASFQAYLAQATIAITGVFNGTPICEGDPAACWQQIIDAIGIP